MPRQKAQRMPILVAQASAATGTAFDVSNYRHVVINFTAPLNASLTVKFQGSFSDVQPTFSSAQAEDNIWDYIAFYDYQTSALTVGDTGVVINNDTAANNTHLFMVNTDHLKWLCATVTSYTDGSVTVTGYGAND